METLEIIPIDQLPILRDLYKLDWPLHVATHSTIQVFVERFANFPEWIKKVKFLILKNFGWKSCGAFVMVDENRVFFNTLEAFPFNDLRRLLLNLELGDTVAFINIRDSLRSLVFDCIRVQYFEVVSDIGTKSFLMPKEVLQRLTIEAPDGFELKPVGKEHVKKINENWTGKFSTSEKFLEQAIEYNPSMGLYDKNNGELIAWNMRLDSGSMGVGRVDTNFGGNLYGHIAISALAVKIANDFDTDVHFEIVNGNLLAEKSARRANLPLIDTQSWVLAKRRKRLSAAIPMWGHL